MPWLPAADASPAVYLAALALSYGEDRAAAVAAQYPPARFDDSATAAFVQARRAGDAERARARRRRRRRLAP